MLAFLLVAPVELLEHRLQLGPDEVARREVAHGEPQRHDLAGEVLGVGEVSLGALAVLLDLLAQNRQDDRDRVQIEQDRQRAERNLADTEYLAREVVALRMAVTDFSDEVLSRDVLRAELKVLLEHLDERGASGETVESDAR